MSVYIEFVTDHFFNDGRVPPPDCETSRRTLADAAVDFFRVEKDAQETYVVLALMQECGIKLRAAFLPSCADNKAHCLEAEKTTIWAFNITRQELTTALSALNKLQQSINHDELHPLICCSYKQD